MSDADGHEGAACSPPPPSSFTAIDSKVSLDLRGGSAVLNLQRLRTVISQRDAFRRGEIRSTDSYNVWTCGHTPVLACRAVS